MNHAEAVERSARFERDRIHGASVGPWEEASEEAREWYRSMADPILAASGYPAALTEATELVRAQYDAIHGPHNHANCPRPLCERARVWLTDHEDTT